MWSQLDILLDREAQESEREFYGLLGIVAVKFAHLEARLRDLLSTLIHSEDELMTATLTQGLDLSRTVELIKKVGRIRLHDTARLYELTSAVNSLRQERNAFVHGIWQISASATGSIEATCSRPKIDYEENAHSKQWTQRLARQPVSLEMLVQMAIRATELARITDELTEQAAEESSP